MAVISSTPLGVETLVKTDNSQQEQQELLKRIRNELHGQRAYNNRSLIEAEYGFIYTRQQLNDHIRKTLRCIPFRTRDTRWQFIREYILPIPDEALLKYHAAKQSNHFDLFYVVTPQYGTSNQPDPWLIARLDDTEMYVVISQWK